MQVEVKDTGSMKEHLVDKERGASDAFDLPRQLNCANTPKEGRVV